MVERTADDEQQVATEPLTCNQVLGIGDDGAMADDDTFGTACGACGIVDVGTVSWQRTAHQAGSDLLKQGLGRVVL